MWSLHCIREYTVYNATNENVADVALAAVCKTEDVGSTPTILLCNNRYFFIVPERIDYLLLITWVK